MKDSVGGSATRLRIARLVSVAGVCGVLSVFGCDDEPNSKLIVGGGGTSTATGGTATTGGAASGGAMNGGASGEIVPLKEAKLNIEHNATDRDTGFQGFIDSEGWTELDVIGPEGPVLSFQGEGKLGELGLTELFFESVEPENADVPVSRVLARLPEGEYTISGTTPDGKRTEGTALLTHDIPAGAVLVNPENGATVRPKNLVMRWLPVTETITGEPVTIISYQLIIEKDDEPDPNAITKPDFSIYVGPSVTSVTVPNEFLEPATAYVWEVLAIEESGNQTVSSGAFSTESE